MWICIKISYTLAFITSILLIVAIFKANNRDQKGG